MNQTPTLSTQNGEQGVQVGDQWTSAKYADPAVLKQAGYVAPGSNTSNQTSPLIVTSSDSRTNYANNLNTVNNAVSNVTVPKYGDEITDMSGNKGIAKFDPNTGKPLANPADATQGSDTGKEDGTDSTRNAIDPSLRDVYDTSLKSLDQGITDAKATLASALSTLQNDPAATAAVNMIMQKYDQQIQLMKDKNKMLLGSDVTNAARSGSLQYANEMTTNFMSEEQDKAQKRVTDLITLEMSKVLEAQAAYKKGDVQAFDEASKALDKATKDKTDAINKLLTETDKIVKEKQAQQKIDAASAKQEISDNIRVSTALGDTIAKSLTDAKITDPKKRREYIEAMATKSGITNPDVLDSAVAKAELSRKNTQTTIDKRLAPKSTTTKTKAYSNFKVKPSAGDISKVNKYISSIGGNQAAIDAASADEARFYKVLSSIPKESSGGTFK